MPSSTCQVNKPNIEVNKVLTFLTYEFIHRRMKISAEFVTIPKKKKNLYEFADVMDLRGSPIGVVSYVGFNFPSVRNVNCVTTK